MGILIMSGMPITPSGHDRWCLVCAGRYKAALVAALGIDADWLKREVIDTPEDHIKVIAPPRGWKAPPLEIAVVDTGHCWSHLQAFNPEAVPEIPPGYQKRPGLITGMS